MHPISGILHNHVLFAALIGWFLAPGLKIPIHYLVEKEWDWHRFHGSGGMPSSHSAAMCALTTAIFLVDSPASPAFAVAAVLSAIVMYDASGVRHETGKQGKTLNMIIRDLFSTDPRYADNAFKELVGHTKLQVLIGALVGVGTGIASYYGFTYLFAGL